MIKWLTNTVILYNELIYRQLLSILLDLQNYFIREHGSYNIFVDKDLVFDDMVQFCLHISLQVLQYHAGIKQYFSCHLTFTSILSDLVYPVSHY